MELTILGSGTFVPELKRSCPSYLVEIEKEKIIFDFGRGAINNLLKLKVNLYDLNKIFISHMHADHFSELASFIQFIFDAPEKSKLNLSYIVYGPIGIKRKINCMLEAINIHEHKNLNRLEIKEISDDEELSFNNFKIKAFQVEHSNSMKCLAYQILEKSKKICYSGDTKDCTNLRKACQNSDLAIIEATYPLELKLGNHLSGEELGKIAKDQQIKRLIVVHVADTYLSRVKKDIRKNFKGEIIIAKDLMKVEI